MDQTPHTHRRISLGFFTRSMEPGETAISRSLEALRLLGPQYANWAIPYSGGKDSTATAAFVLWAIERKFIEPPKTLTVLRSDTTQELPELNHNAELFMAEVRRRGFSAITVGPALKDRFYVNILGRGLLPVHASLRGRWCTRVLKVKPMEAALAKTSAALSGEKFLMMAGVRFNESKQRDSKLNNLKQLAATACSKDSGECGAGGIWMDRMSERYTGLPLIVNWRECLVYNFLQGWFFYKEQKGHGLEQFTRPIARMYGQQEDGLIGESLRFGCLGCSVVSDDKMTRKAAEKNPKLTPLLELHAIWQEMRTPCYRHWKPSNQATKFAKGHSGPLSIPARKYFFRKIGDIQNRSETVLITPEDVVEINRCWQEKVFPRGWTGNEILASEVPKDSGFFSV